MQGAKGANLIALVIPMAVDRWTESSFLQFICILSAVHQTTAPYMMIGLTRPLNIQKLFNPEISQITFKKFLWKGMFTLYKTRRHLHFVITDTKCAPFKN
uniref:Uncharacterized protein n=1 Tax=Megaselia scalaris TaxID=36166 RepID=T1GUR7_MEGSC